MYLYTLAAVWSFWCEAYPDQRSTPCFKGSQIWWNRFAEGTVKVFFWSSGPIDAFLLRLWLCWGHSFLLEAFSWSVILWMIGGSSQQLGLGNSMKVPVFILWSRISGTFQCWLCFGTRLNLEDKIRKFSDTICSHPESILAPYNYLSPSWLFFQSLWNSTSTVKV